MKAHLVLAGGTLSGDDSVIDKPYRDPERTELLGYFWSGKHKRAVKGINLITLYYTDILGTSYPVNFRVYDKRAGKTKNDYFRDMILEVSAWGLETAWVTGDCWYSSLENLKFLRHEKVGFLFGIAANRQVSIERGQGVRVQTLTIPEAGLLVYLKEFGWVKVFCQTFKNEVRYYIFSSSIDDELPKLTRSDFLRVHDCHWRIEQVHCVIKQVCNTERFHVRAEAAIKTHVFCALQAFCKLQTMRVEGLIDNLYQGSRQLFVPVIRQFIQANLPKPV